MHATLELLRNSEESIDEVARKADVSFYWLRKFSAGTARDPSVNKVQRVYEYLAQRPLLDA